MKNKREREEIKAAKHAYEESGAILDYMRLDYLKHGAAAFNPPEE